MSSNPFIEKYKSKSTEELEAIANNSKTFVLDARYAAASILKGRNISLPVIGKIESEVEKLKEQEKKEKSRLQIDHIKLKLELESIQIKTTRKYKLDNGNELQVKRLDEKKFRVRIEDNSRSFLSPVLICIIDKEKKNRYFPFFYLTTLIFWGVGGTVLLFILYLFNVIEYNLLLITMPLVYIGGFQVLMAPIMSFIILSQFKKRLGS